MFTPKQKTYGLIYLIALIVSVLLYNFVLLEFLPKIEIKDLIFDNSSPKAFSSVFYDLDDDNDKEIITFGVDSGDSSVNFITVFNNEKYIGQYNFRPTRMGINWIGYSDLNNDNKKEIIAFYEKDDTIYTTIIDWANDKYIAENVFVMAKPDTIYSNVWAPLLKVIGDVKNSSNETEIIFSITTGFSQIPRGVFAFNTDSLKVTKKFLIGASIESVKLFDLTKDGNPEIIINSISSSNNGSLPQLPEYDDFKSWLIVLDNNFDTLFTKNMPLPLGGTLSSYIITENENFLITEFFAGTQVNLFKIDKAGRVFKSKISNDAPYYLCDYVYGEKQNILASKNKTLIVLDPKLNQIEEHHYDSQIRFPYLINIDDDIENEIILIKWNGIDILDDDYSIIKSLDESIKYASSNSSITHSNTLNGINLRISYPGQNLRFTIIPNSLYSFRYLFFLAILIGVSFIGLVLNILLNQMFVFINVLENTTQKSNQGIIVLKSIDDISFANKSAMQFLSTENQIINNKNDLTIEMSKNRALQKYISNTFINHSKLDQETILFNRNIFQVSLIPIKTPLNFLIAVFVQIENLTEMINNDRAKTLAHSIQKVAHEIKTPLSSVLLSMDSIESTLNNYNTKNDEKEDIKVVRTEIERVKNFINNFLKFANMDAPEDDVIELKTLVESSILRFSSYISRGIEIIVKIPDDIIVRGDSYQLEDAFQVFIENSIDALKGNGKIIIEALIKSENIVRINISDNGNGIDEKDIDSIFQPYMTTKKDGTGMGLSIAQKIVKDHGSDILVESELGKGTMFSFNLNIGENKKPTHPKSFS